MLLLEGLGQQREDWHVEEKSACGYSRIYYPYRGTIAYTAEGNRQILPLKKLYIFPSVSPFAIRHDPSDPLACLWLHIDFFPVRISKLLTLDVPENSPLWHHLQLLWNCLENGRKATPYFHELVKAFTLFLTESVQLPQYSAAISDIVYYLREHFKDNKTTVQAVSHHFGYSTEHFIRLFREQMNITPYQYLLGVLNNSNNSPKVV